MGTRALTCVREGNKEILCLYRQMDGYPDGHGKDLLNAFKGFRITNGITVSGEKAKPSRTANGMGCFAAQLVCFFKRPEGKVYYPGAHGVELGGHYIMAPETREVGEEFVYMISEKNDKLWLDLYEGEVAWFGFPGSKPELFDWLYSGYLDDFNPSAKLGMIYHGEKGTGTDG